MRLNEYLNKRIIKLAGGISKYDGEQDEDRLLFINDKRKIVNSKLQEYDVWYCGDSDEILNYYTRETNIEYNYEPLYSRNKRGYFWSIASTENDIKRTHSGQPRNIVDTLTSLIGKPEIAVGMKENEITTSTATIEKVFEENDFWDMYMSEQMSMTLVEGWGCYKIDWDLDVSELPIIKYYRAKDVDFVYKDKRLTAIIFKDYYTDGKSKQYLITETRAVKRGSLYIYKEIFKIIGDDIQFLNKEELASIEELAEIDVEPVVITNYKGFFATPCLFYKDTVNNDGYGRSIYAGKIDLFDDLDQCLSQSSNTVRRSTAIEYFNTDFLERDKKTGLPKMPHAYDRKYTSFVGGKNSDGTQNTDTPVQVTQPQLQFSEYSIEAQNILLQIFSGLISPATMGIDVAKKDNADAQREKEKVTIFTRNVIINSEKRILKSLINQVLEAVQYIRQGQITCHEYTITIKYSEFADDSFENKLTKLGEAYSKGTISTDMYLDKLYGDSLNSSDRAREKKYLEENQGSAGDEGDDEGFNMGDGKPGFSGLEPGE